MDDTSIHMRHAQLRVWRSKTFEERMRLGAAASAMALDAARRLADREHPGDPAGLFLLIHGDSFAPAERDRIAMRIRAHFAARAS